MLISFKNNIISSFPFMVSKKLFIAVSGGLDSMVLLHLCKKLGYTIAVLHCNFGLRGKESDEETRFLNNYCKNNEIPFFKKYFNTKEYAKKNKISIQMAARTLRYQWFYEQLDQHNFHYILTAHHTDDSLETFLINLSRGTGIKGLTGIPQKNDKIIRPLLNFSRETILKYAQKEQLEWREDSSNASDNYLRNKIRHQITPLLKELNPNFLNHFLTTQSLLQQTVEVLNETVSNQYKKVAEEKENAVYFSIKEIKTISNHNIYLYEWLHPFGFTAWKDIYNLLNATTGKKVLSPTHTLLKNRNHLVLFKSSELAINKVFIVKKNKKEVNFPIKLLINKVCFIENNNNNSIFVNYEKLKFPLKIRKRKEGDIFFPIGMQGKKKLSKYYKDEKMSLLDKENQWLLTNSDDTIIWVIGKRADNRCKPENNKKTVKIEFIP